MKKKSQRGKAKSSKRVRSCQTVLSSTPKIGKARSAKRHGSITARLASGDSVMRGSTVKFDSGPFRLSIADRVRASVYQDKYEAERNFVFSRASDRITW